MTGSGGFEPSTAVEMSLAQAKKDRTLRSKAYVLQCILFFAEEAYMSERSAIVTVRLSRRDLQRMEAVRALEDVDRSTLLKEFIEDGLRRRVIHLYQRGRLTAGRAAEILGVSLREFLEILEREGIPVNWDSESVKKYLEAKYGESSVAPGHV